MYGQIANATRPEGRPLLRYKDKLKSNISSLKLPSTRWESLALQRNEWRTLCNQHVTHFEEGRIEKMVKSRQDRKAPPPANTNSAAFVCVICNKICKSNAGLASHKRSHPAAAPSSPGRSTCEICNKVCKNEHGLKVHKRVHNR